MTFEIPPSLRKARIADGESDWLDALPDLLGETASLWSLKIGDSFDGFGMNALVVEATMADGTEAVLKLAPPSEVTKIDLEATVLRLADGAAAFDCSTLTSAAERCCSNDWVRRCTTWACRGDRDMSS